MPDLKTIYDSAEVPADFKHALGLQAVWDAGFTAGLDHPPAVAAPPEPAIVITDGDGATVDPATLNA